MMNEFRQFENEFSRFSGKHWPANHLNLAEHFARGRTTTKTNGGLSQAIHFQSIQSKVIFFISDLKVVIVSILEEIQSSQ
jgi:hypothetical protein